MVLLDWKNRIIHGDAVQVLKRIPDNSVDMVMTSPPYWGLRDYGMDAYKIWDGETGCMHEWMRGCSYYDRPRHGMNSSVMKVSRVAEASGKIQESMVCCKCGAWYGQLGMEPSPEMYVTHLMQVFRELKRVLKPSGSFYLNMGDTYARKNLGRQVSRKSLCMIPERVALAMINDGWILRNKIIWYKPNSMPSSAKDRLSNTWEYLFHFVKRQKYYYNLEAVREPYTGPMNRWGGEKLRASGKSAWDEATGQNTYRNRNMRPNPDGKNPGDLFKIPTRPFPEAHFSVYPEKLCEAPIKAACPEYVCKKCGQPGRQVVSIKPDLDAFNIRVRDVSRGRIKSADRRASEAEIRKYEEKKYRSQLRELVIAEGCKCNSGFEPGIVLDPFCGSGTTCLVAKKLGRYFTGIDINGKYCEMAERRLKKIDKTK